MGRLDASTPLRIPGSGLVDTSVSCYTVDVLLPTA